MVLSPCSRILIAEAQCPVWMSVLCHSHPTTCSAGSVVIWGKITSLPSTSMRTLHDSCISQAMRMLISRATLPIKQKTFKLHIPKLFMKERSRRLSSHQGIFVQQRILQARGHGTGTVTSQALPTLRAVPGKLLVLPRAQHPLQLQNKQDHRHSALMR